MRKLNLIKIIVIVLVFALLARLIYKKYINNESKIQVPVLLYHHFLSDEEKQEYEPDKNYSVSIVSFEKQMKYLYDNGYTSITPEQMLCWKLKKCEIPEKSFMITIDDGQKSVLEYAEPILKKYGFNATAFVISSRVNEEKEEFNPAIYQYFSKEEIHNTGTIYIGSHTHDMHRMVGDKKRILTMTYEEMFDDVKLSNDILNTKYIAYPYNTYNSEFISAIRNAGYELGFRGQSRKTIQSEDRFMIYNQKVGG